MEGAFNNLFLKLLIETINDTALLSGRAVAKRAKEEFFFKCFFFDQLVDAVVAGFKASVQQHIRTQA